MSLFIKFVWRHGVSYICVSSSPMTTLLSRRCKILHDVPDSSRGRPFLALSMCILPNARHHAIDLISLYVALNSASSATSGPTCISIINQVDRDLGSLSDARGDCPELRKIYRKIAVKCENTLDALNPQAPDHVRWTALASSWPSTS